jgi:uncharacterized OB-fold protein
MLSGLDEEDEMSDARIEETAKPSPRLEGLTGEFYGWTKRGELRFQQCLRCEAWRHVPRVICPECASPEWSWAPSTGRGRVFTWTVVVRAMDPAFAAEVPYAPAVIELEEGVRMLSLVVDCPPEELEFEMPVEVVFEDVTAEVTLPKFRRA